MFDVLDAERIAELWPDMSALGPRDFLLAFYPDAPVPAVDALPQGPPLVARINHGYWLVSCDCNAADVPAPGMVVWLAYPVAWCVRCNNAASGGHWRPVIVPPADERAAIVAVLGVRPDVATRNWSPGETVAELVAENAVHLAGGA